MKDLISALMLLPVSVLAQSSATGASVSAQMAPEGDRIVVEARGVKPETPLFFTATADNTVRVDPDAVTGEIRLTLRILQGRPKVLTLGLAGGGDVMDVTGEGLGAWAVRQSGGRRFLDLTPVQMEGKMGGGELRVTIRTRVDKPSIPGWVQIPILLPGDAVGFASRIALVPAASIELRVTNATGLLPLADAPGQRAALQFYGTGDASLEARLLVRGAALADAELAGTRLAARLDEAARCVRFILTGEARVKVAGARVAFLGGDAALDETTSGDGWHAELRDGKTDIVFEKAGAYLVTIPFTAALKDGREWRSVNLRMPAGTVVPVQLEGFPKGLTFNETEPLVPDRTSLSGFVPADGTVRFGWRRSGDAAEGTLFFTSHEQNEVRVGAGLLRQTSRIDFRILQGRLPGVKIRLDGPGEILGVDGANILGWKVVEEGGRRVLEVRLSRPLEKSGSIVVRSQLALGNFPVKAAPMRFTPEGGVRNSGFLRVANDGAVRLEMTGVSGMMQLSPEQYPGGAVESAARQVFVYRFPSASYACDIVASQILPEVGVSQVLVYELGDTDRIIRADLELDIREAPLREWSLRIPADYAVVAVNGASVADYAAESAAEGGSRALKILFGQPVDGRQLVHLRLEKNQPAGAGEWQLPPLSFPGAKSVRGHVGVVATSGFRVVPGETNNLAETPLSYFPVQLPGLQQAWRVREPAWTAQVRTEALGQSVQADVFHLYSLKEGVVAGSVLINYFVIGAPANEWRIRVPSAIGNIDVTGQNIRRDWRREGDEIIVSLHQPVLGPATVLITFEQPMSARGGVIDPGEVQPLGVQSERGYVQVVSPLQVKSKVLKADGGLLRLEPSELPAEFRLLTSSPSLAVYQYIARPFALEMNVEWYAPAETVDQVVDFAKLASHVSRDGQIVTDVHYFVKTRGRKALRFVLPEGVKLWEARADREVVSARIDGDQTIVPLPPRLNPNEPVEVTLRLGQASTRASSPELTSPRALSPTVMSEWTISGDPGQLLVPRGGSAVLEGPVLTESGFEWISARAPLGAVVVVLLLALAGRLGGSAGGWKMVGGFLLAAVVAVLAMKLALMAANERHVNRDTLTCAATVVPAGEAVTVLVANVAAWRAMISGWGIAAGVAGLVLLGAGAMRVWGERGRAGWWVPAGTALLAVAVLAQRGGAIVFFQLVAAVAFLAIMIPLLIRWLRRPRAIAEPAAALFLAAACLGVAPQARAQEAPAPEAIAQRWEITNGRLRGEIDVRVRGVAGDSFLLLRPPAVLTGFTGEGLRVTKLPRDGETVYFVALERDGVLSGHASFELELGRNGTKEVPLLTGPTASQRVAVQLDEAGWEFFSPDAVSVQPLAPAEGRSGAAMVFRSGKGGMVQIRPRTRDVAAEKTEFYAEAANLFIPGPGVVNGYCRVTIRPVQGRVSELELDVPRGFTVGDVGNGPVGNWRFDPVARKLRVSVTPAQEGNFRFDVETQLGTSDLPVDLTLSPIRVAGASGEVGMIGLAFGSDAQPENVRGPAAVNTQDFDAALIPRTSDGRPLATLQQVFRYGRDGATVSLKVAPVAPEIRATTRQVLSFGDERLLMAVDLHVSITRAGVFQLGFELPDFLEVETITGAALSNWTETHADGRRVVTLQLTGRTIGEQDFHMAFVAAAPAAGDGWEVPRLTLSGATRQIGQIFLVPGKGIRLRALARENVSYLDPRAEGEAQAGALAFRLLQQNWSVRLGIEALEPWVTAQALQDVTLREGQTLTRIGVRYRVENAAVRQLRVRIPNLSQSQQQTIRASGAAVSDFTRVPGEPELWDIHFQRGIAGETDVQIEFQGESVREQGQELVRIPIFEGARQVTQFVAVRSSGRLEIDARGVPRGWQQADWSGVPADLQGHADRSVPALCYRVAEPEGPLSVNVQRHDVADSLKLRVRQGDFTTLFSVQGPSITSARLMVDVVEKSSLRVRLPKGAALMSAFVNAESVAVVRDGDSCLFYVAPNTDTERVAEVRIVYSVPTERRGSVDIVGPSLDVPLEDVSWDVILPAGHTLAGYEGSLRLTGRMVGGDFGVKDYVNLSSVALNSEARKATALIEEANSLLKSGQQLQAGEVLSRAAKTNTGDEAFNEDARVQLRSLKTQQAVVGLNTRRQRLYLDNRSNGMAVQNAQMEQAASQNSVMQGSTNFDIQQVDQLLLGNSADENAALRGIADRIVEQQLSAESAPGAIDVTLPKSGNVATFARSIQVDGDAALSMKLKISRPDHASPVSSLLILAAAAFGGAGVFPRRKS